RSNAFRTLSLSHLCKINVRLKDFLPNPLVFDRPLPFSCNKLLMHLVVVERRVICDQHQAGNFVVGCRPHCGDPHQEVPIAVNTNTYSATALKRQRSTNGHTWTGANPAPSCRSDIVQ